MSRPLPRLTKQKRPLSAVSKKKIAKAYAGALLKSVTLADLAGATLTRPEIGYILAYVHQIGDRLSGIYRGKEQDFPSITRHFEEGAK